MYSFHDVMVDEVESIELKADGWKPAWVGVKRDGQSIVNTPDGHIQCGRWVEDNQPQTFSA